MSRTRLSRAICSLILHRDKRGPLGPNAVRSSIGQSNGVAYQLEANVPSEPPSEDLFLRTGWVHIYPGLDPGKIYYPSHILSDYTAWVIDNGYPAYLDKMNFPGLTFDVEAYSAWIDDTQVYTAGSQRQNDAIHNHYAHGGRLGLFTRCCLGSKLDPSLFLATLLLPSTTLLSYFIHVDTNLDYWFIRVTNEGCWRAKILWWPIADDLHAWMKTTVGAGNRISRTSVAHEDLRKAEGYLFAAAHNVGAWQELEIFSTEVQGLSVYYGWQADWNGDNAAHTTLVWEPGVTEDFEGIRSRIYTLVITASSAVLSEKDNEIGTPDINDITIYYPDEVTTPGRMAAWFPKSITQTWDEELETDMPFHAFYKEDDTLCEVWFKHAIDVFMPQTTYNGYVNSRPPLCAAGGFEKFSVGSGGGNKIASGFYIKNSPGQAIDLYTETTGGNGIYELQWRSGLGGGGGPICLTAGLNGHARFATKDCTGGTSSDENDWGHCCGPHHKVDVSCGDAHLDRDYYASRTQLNGPVMFFNFNKPDSVTLIKRLYEGWSGHVSVIRNWYDVILEWNAFGGGSGRSGLYWGDWGGGELFVTLVGVTTSCAGYSSLPSCAASTEGTATTSGKQSSGVDIKIEHYLITDSEVLTILDESYDNWNDVGFYEFIFEPTFQYPYIDAEVSCRAPLENYIATGDFLSFPSVPRLPLLTDMTIIEEHLGYLTIPIGRT